MALISLPLFSAEVSEDERFAYFTRGGAFETHLRPGVCQNFDTECLRHHFPQVLTLSEKLIPIEKALLQKHMTDFMTFLSRKNKRTVFVEETKRFLLPIVNGIPLNVMEQSWENPSTKKTEIFRTISGDLGQYHKLSLMIESILAACGSGYQNIQEGKYPRMDVGMMKEKMLLLQCRKDLDLTSEECEKLISKTFDFFSSQDTGSFGPYLADIIIKDKEYDDYILAMLKKVEALPTPDAPFDLWAEAMMLTKNDPIKATRLIMMTTYDPGPYETSKTVVLRLRKLSTEAQRRGESEKARLLSERANKMLEYVDKAPVLMTPGTVAGNAFFNGRDINLREKFTPHHFMAGVFVSQELTLADFPRDQAKYMSFILGVAYETQQLSLRHGRPPGEALQEFVTDSHSHYAGGILGAEMAHQYKKGRYQAQTVPQIQSKIESHESEMRDLLVRNYGAAKAVLAGVTRETSDVTPADFVQAAKMGMFQVEIPLINHGTEEFEN